MVVERQDLVIVVLNSMSLMTPDVGRWAQALMVTASKVISSLRALVP